MGRNASGVSIIAEITIFTPFRLSNQSQRSQQQQQLVQEQHQLMENSPPLPPPLDAFKPREIVSPEGATLPCDTENVKSSNQTEDRSSPSSSEDKSSSQKDDQSSIKAGSSSQSPQRECTVVSAAMTLPQIVAVADVVPTATVVLHTPIQSPELLKSPVSEVSSSSAGIKFLS